MSARLFPDDLKFEQRLLKSAGFYTGKIDGRYGPLTIKAEQQADGAYSQIADDYGRYDPRSEKNIATLLPSMQIKARQILKIARQMEVDTGINAVVLSGTRDYAEQDALFAKRPKVTNARGGFSNHNFGIAIDIGLFKDGRYMTGSRSGDDAAYKALALAVKSNVTNIEWGGNWAGFVDLPHYQLATGMKLSQVRVAFEAGQLNVTA